MALTGPGDRTITIDLADGTTATDFSALIVSIEGAGELDIKSQELTGPTATAPVNVTTGFARAADITVVFQADLGGSPDPVAAFYEDTTTARTFLVSYVTGWTFSVETNIISSKPTMPVEDDTLLEVVFQPTGAWTIT